MLNAINFISIIVCTYNRADILRDCLVALTTQTVTEEKYEIIVVDNNSTDNTKEIVSNFEQRHKNIRYVIEKKQGLSISRNTGYKEAKGDWVGYMDDDGKVNINYIERSLFVINNFDFDCFGGAYDPWFKYGRPRWMSPEFGKSKQFQDEVGVLLKGNNSGGIIFFKKSVLEILGGFSSSLGMAGKKIAYGEESYVQSKMRENGLTIGYDPENRMLHLVQEHKLKLSWHIKMSYAKGRDTKTFNNSNKKKTKLSIIIYSLKLLRDGVNKNSLKLLKQKNFYWQNFILEVVGPVAFYLGSQTNKKLS